MKIHVQPMRRIGGFPRQAHIASKKTFPGEYAFAASRPEVSAKRITPIAAQRRCHDTTKVSRRFFNDDLQEKARAS
ncbi:hypothetical protein [Noviherbaspirillum autotrophicum]|uniref:hypothetical protein n=1 Tax=Noviherbaspirillum autotrophicum TaxID=709839 RepID=UPI0018E0538F|nr:hypothetical protein [Noviherbaspirillum autotrophicum]